MKKNRGSERRVHRGHGSVHAGAIGTRRRGSETAHTGKHVAKSTQVVGKGKDVLARKTSHNIKAKAGKAPDTLKSNAVASVKKLKPDKKTVIKLEEAAKAAASMNNARISVSEPSFSEFISRNVGTRANDILSTLISGPLVDDKIAEQLSLKPNETRRMLNVLNTYGLVRYNINKNNEGWLSFMWYLDFESIKGLETKINTNTGSEVLPAGCNDFFVCSECSKSHKIVLPFEVALDNKFRCGCGKKLESISRLDAEQMYRTATA